MSRDSYNRFPVDIKDTFARSSRLRAFSTTRTSISSRGAKTARVYYIISFQWVLGVGVRSRRKWSIRWVSTRGPCAQSGSILTRAFSLRAVMMASLAFGSSVLACFVPHESFPPSCLLPHHCDCVGETPSPSRIQIPGGWSLALEILWFNSLYSIYSFNIPFLNLVFSQSCMLWHRITISGVSSFWSRWRHAMTTSRDGTKFNDDYIELATGWYHLLDG